MFTSTDLPNDRVVVMVLRNESLLGPPVVLPNFCVAATRISAALVAALGVTWAAIVTRHPEVPAAVVVVASGTDGHKLSQARWGHFAALR